MTYIEGTFGITPLEKRVDKHTHDELMSIGHTLDILIHIDSFRAQTAIAEAVHDVVIKPLHVYPLSGSRRRNAIGKSFEY